MTQFGEDFAAFALQNSNDKEKGYIDTPPCLISVKSKTIKKVKYIKEQEITRIITLTDGKNETYKGRRKNYQEPTETEGITRKRSHTSEYENLFAGEDGENYKSKRYHLRENLHQPRVPGIFSDKKVVGTGQYYPAVWKVEYDDLTIGEEDQKDIEKLFGINFMNFCINISSQKFIPIPVGANKESHLSNWPSLIRRDAPKVEYNQKGTVDLCVPKAFSSVLHHVGFVVEARLLDTKFNSKVDCFTKRDGNLQAIYQYAQVLLPNWLQCTQKRIKKIKWNEGIQAYDLFLGVLLGSDGHANHAVAIFNGWIFDSNENRAIPLCQEGLNYCVSTANERVEFVCFNDGFFFRENSTKRKLKRKYEGENLILSKFARTWSIEF